MHLHSCWDQRPLKAVLRVQSGQAARLPMSYWHVLLSDCMSHRVHWGLARPQDTHNAPAESDSRWLTRMPHTSPRGHLSESCSQSEMSIRSTPHVRIPNGAQVQSEPHTRANNLREKVGCTPKLRIGLCLEYVGDPIQMAGAIETHLHMHSRQGRRLAFNITGAACLLISKPRNHKNSGIRPIVDTYSYYIRSRF